MMAKIVKGKGFKGCVNYILDKNKDASILDTDGVRLKSKASIIRSFIIQALLKPNLSKSVGHISLSFSAQDKNKITNEMMVKVARDYMQKMNIKDTQYIVVRHFDKEHPHIHLCFDRVDNNGKTISDKNDRYRSEKICKELTEKYGLYMSSGKENVKMHRLKEPDKSKYEIYHALNTIIPKCSTWQQLLHTLKKQGIDIKFKYKGKTDEIQGIIFSKNGYSFNGSKVDRIFSYSKINYQLKQNHFSQNQSQNGVISQNTNQSKGIIGSLIDVAADLGSAESNGGNYEEDAFRNRMEYEEQKHKRKNKYRRKL